MHKHTHTRSVPTLVSAHTYTQKQRNTCEPERKQRASGVRGREFIKTVELVISACFPTVTVCASAVCCFFKCKGPFDASRQRCPMHWPRWSEASVRCSFTSYSTHICLWNDRSNCVYVCDILIFLLEDRSFLMTSFLFIYLYCLFVQNPDFVLCFLCFYLQSVL